jgi:dipeptidyl aminopeptidase/acylaminoacyl peptidase
MEDGGPLVNLTKTLKSVPDDLIPTDDARKHFVGVDEGMLVEVSVEEHGARIMSRGLAKDGVILWRSESQPLDHILVGEQNGTELSMVDLSSGTAQRIQKPRAEATLAGYSPTRAITVFEYSGYDGTYLWTCKNLNGKCLEILRTNAFLANVKPMRYRVIRYRSLDGRELEGLLTLPVDYKEGIRYPLIASVYLGGECIAEMEDGRHAVPDTNPMINVQLLAAHGYAVLEPCMPFSLPPNEAGDPYEALLNGLTPAIDRVLELGIADPERLGVMGTSFGGFSVFGIVEQTNRFRAAVSLVGASDWASFFRDEFF